MTYSTYGTIHLAYSTTYSTYGTIYLAYSTTYLTYGTIYLAYYLLGRPNFNSGWLEIRVKTGRPYTTTYFPNFPTSSTDKLKAAATCSTLKPNANKRGTASLCACSASRLACSVS